MKFPESAIDALVSEISRTDSLDWREFHFFKAGGLSRNDQLSNRICLDYELARECRQIVELLAHCSQKQRQEVLSLQSTSRYAAFPCSDGGLVKAFEQVASLPSIPTVCIAASWFPSPWLSAPETEGRKIVKTLARFYDTRPLAVSDFPVKDRQEEKLLIASAALDTGTTLHVFAIDKTQTESALIAAFRAWIKKQRDITGADSRRGRVKIVAALRDLGCYRLMTKLDAASRQATMDEVGFKQSVPKLSEAKRRTAKRLRSLGYM